MTATASTFKHAADAQKQPVQIEMIAYTRKQIARGLIAAGIAGAAIGGFVAGKISYGFGTLSGIECTTNAVSDFVEGPKDGVAKEIYYSAMGECVRKTEFPMLKSYTIKR